MTTTALAPIEEQLKEYEKKGYNVLWPSVTVQEISPYHKLSVEVVRLSTNPADGDVYLQYDGDGRKDITDETDLSLTKKALFKLSHGAGINIDPMGSRRTDDGSNPLYCEFRAVGDITKNDGTVRKISDHYGLDLEAIEEEIRGQYERKANKEIRDGRKLYPNKDQWITDRVRRDMLKKRKYRLQLAETGAILRVIRQLLALKSTYKRKELTSPFVVPRIGLNIEALDRETRLAVLLQGEKAIQALYGQAFSNNTDYRALPYSTQEEEAHEEVEGDKDGSGDTSPGVIDVPPPDSSNDNGSQSVPFEELSAEKQIEVLKELMERKPYDKSKLRKPVEELSEHWRKEFYRFLSEISDDERPF